MSLMRGETGLVRTLQERMDYGALARGEAFAVAVLELDEGTREKGPLSVSSYATTVQGLLLNSANCGAVSTGEMGEIVAIFAFRNEEGRNTDSLRGIIERVMSRFDRWIAHINAGSIDLSAGIGLIHPGISHIDRSYAQARKALEKGFFCNDRRVFVFDEHDDVDPEYEKQWIKDFLEEANLIVSEAVTGNAERVEMLIEPLIRRFVRDKLCPKIIKDYCYVMLFLLNVSLSEFRDRLEISEILRSDFETKVKNARSIQELQQFVTGLFVTAAQQIRAIGQSRQGNTYKRKAINSVKEYIEENYYQDLSLEDLSKHVFLSPVYLSVIFKSMTGENYRDYVKKVRLEKAKELLRQVELKVYEVGKLVGYDDYKYFTIQFKKKYGLSPTEFRRRCVG